jgi:hypothetical protein
VHRRDVADVVTDSSAIRLIDDQAMHIAVAFNRKMAKQPNSQLCRAYAGLLGVSGVGITIMSGEQAGPVCISNPRIRALDRIAVHNGARPLPRCLPVGQPGACCRARRPVEILWPTADVATIAIVQDLASRKRPYERESCNTPLDSRVSIEQAKGMIAATLGVDMSEAFRQLLAADRNNNRDLTDVANEFVAGTLNLKVLARRRPPPPPAPKGGNRSGRKASV